jgi:hypothetical protein
MKNLTAKSLLKEVQEIKKQAFDKKSASRLELREVVDFANAWASIPAKQRSSFEDALFAGARGIDPDNIDPKMVKQMQKVFGGMNEDLDIWFEEFLTYYYGR